MTLRCGRYGRFWGCSMWPYCDGRVACVEGTIIPNGTVTDQVTRDARRAAHAAFDAIWKPLGKAWRGRAYRFLYESIGAGDGDWIHMAHADVSQCFRVWEFAASATPEDLVEWFEEGEQTAS